MDEFGNILNNATNEANQTYQSNTASAAAAQDKANQEYANVNSEADLANANAQKLSSLGDQYSNIDNITNTFNQDEQSQLNNMGFDKQTLNNANQNIAQETGQLGAANNQIAAQGGTRGFNASGVANRQAGVQSQLGGAISANTTVQQNELGQANAAAQYTGQEINAQQTSQGNAISAYNDAAQQNNNTMANYAQSLSTMAQQATTYGGLVGSNVANLMGAAKSAADAALDKYQAQLAVAQANEANASAYESTTQGHLNEANTALTRQQIAYNNQMEPLQEEAQKTIMQNSKNASAQIAYLQNDINYQISGENSMNGYDKFAAYLLNMIGGNTITNNISRDQSQINELQGSVIGGNSTIGGNLSGNSGA